MRELRTCAATQGGQKRMLYALKGELQTAVPCPTCVLGTPAVWAFCKWSKYS